MPFTFVPRYMFYILSELLKNAVRATVEQHSFTGSAEMVPVTLVAGGPSTSSIAASIAASICWLTGKWHSSGTAGAGTLRCALDVESPASGSPTQEASDRKSISNHARDLAVPTLPLPPFEHNQTC